MRHGRLRSMTLCALLTVSCGGTQGTATQTDASTAEDSRADAAIAPDVAGSPDVAPTADVVATLQDALEPPDTAEDSQADTAQPPPDIADGAMGPDGAQGTDVAQATDTSIADGATADGATADGATGDTSDGACTFPTPLLGPTPETAALAQSPARCDQPAHTWLDVPELGQVLGFTHKITIPAQLLTDLAATENWTLPHPVDHDVSVDQIRYLTQDRGQLVEATAAIAWPTDLPAGTPPRDVLLFLHGTTGFMDLCAPSNDLGSQGLAALFAAWGYMVVAPDFIGLKGAGDPTGFPHPYLVGQATAIASLDAVRAAARLEPGQRGGVCLSPRVLALGISQGGHAALWVDRLQPYYAAELDLLGVVAAVPPANVVAQAQRALQAPMPGTANTIAMLSTMASWYGGEDHLGELFIPPLDVQIPAALAASCSPADDLGDLALLEDVFQPPVLEAAQAGTIDGLTPWGCYLEENGLTSTSVPRLAPTTPSYGVLFVLGAEDTLVDTPTERQSAATLCEQGMPIVALECAGADHIEATLFALPEILDFIDARAAGLPVDPSTKCVIAPALTCAGTPN